MTADDRQRGGCREGWGTTQSPWSMQGVPKQLILQEFSLEVSVLIGTTSSLPGS